MADLVEEFWDLDVIESLYRDSRASPEDFRDAFHQRFERRGRMILTGSARRALRLLLESAAAKSRKQRVMISSFNCRHVADAVVQAGLAVDSFDLANPTGQVDWDHVGRGLTHEHLAVVVPHFYGIPTDFSAIVPAARRKGVLIVEDCAHALGAWIRSTRAGQLGDAAMFSFNYDKPISLAGGGALLINDLSVDIDAAAIEEPGSRRQELLEFRQMAATLRYGRKWRLQRSLWVRIGAKLQISPYAAPKLPTGIGSLRAAAGIWQLERYDEIRNKRNLNARILRRSLGRLAWHVGETVQPAYLKLRIMVPHSARNTVINRCARFGIIVTNSNWAKVVESDGPENGRSNARAAATLGLDVPVHQNLSTTDIENIAAAFESVTAP